MAGKEIVAHRASDGEICGVAITETLPSARAG